MFLIAPLHCFYQLLFGFLLSTTAVLTTYMTHTCTYTTVRYCSITELAPLLDEGEDEEWCRSIGRTITCNGRQKTAIYDTRLAPTSKPKVEYGGNHINELAVPDFLFAFNTICGPVCHRLAVKNYFRFQRNRK